MNNSVIFVFLCFVITYGVSTNSTSLKIVSRAEWGARPARAVTPLLTPVPYVVIHHTERPLICLTRQQCEHDMRAMQSVHQNVKGWADIGYNFAIGGDGLVYEGRGWTRRGAHAVNVNRKSLGICFIGNYNTKLPPPHSIAAAKQLIARGVKLGYISATYRLVGHRQVGRTTCPGKALFDNIKTWDRFSSKL